MLAYCRYAILMDGGQAIGHCHCSHYDLGITRIIIEPVLTQLKAIIRCNPCSVAENMGRDKPTTAVIMVIKIGLFEVICK